MPRAKDSKALSTMDDPLAKGKQVAESTVILEIHFRSPLFRAKADVSLLMSGVDGDSERPDADLISATKKLLVGDELSAIQKDERDFKKWCALRTVPSTFLGDGFYLLPISNIDEVDKKILDIKRRREVHVEGLVQTYSEAKSKAKAKLRDEFKDSNYPPASQLPHLFRIDDQILTIDVAAALRGIKSDIYDRMSKKRELQMQDTYNLIQESLRYGMLEVVGELETRMQPDPDGKKKKYRGPLDRVNAFLDTFAARDITDDKQLRQLVDKAKKLLAGVDTKKLKDDAFRETMQQNFAGIKTQLSKMVVTQTRKVSLTEDV